MTDHTLELNESSDVSDHAGTPLPSRKQYRVTDKAVRASTDESQGSDGIFKNGHVYTPGDVLELDEKTAAAFLAVGEIEEVEQTEGNEDAQSN